MCLIRPPAPEPPRPPAPAPAAGPAGHALFQDVSGERAGDAGAVALGVVSLAVSLQVSVVSLPVSPCTLSLSACPRLCGSLTLLFPVSMSVPYKLTPLKIELKVKTTNNNINTYRLPST